MANTISLFYGIIVCFNTQFNGDNSLQLSLLFRHDSLSLSGIPSKHKLLQHEWFSRSSVLLSISLTLKLYQFWLISLEI